VTAWLCPLSEVLTVTTDPPKVDPKQARLVAQWPAGRPIVCCRFDPTGRFLFCGLESSTLERFDVADGKKASFEGGHTSWVFSLAFSPSGLTFYSGGGDGRIVSWETGSSSPKPIRTIEAHKGWIRAIAASPDGKLLASGGNDRVVRLWDSLTGKLVRELTGHTGHIYSLEYHSTGKTLLSADLLGVIKEWDPSSGQALGAFDAKALHTYERGQQVDFGGVRGIASSPDHAHIAAGGLHKATNPLGAVHEPLVLVFDAKTRKLARTLLTDGIAGGVIWRLRYLCDGSLMGGCGGSNGGILLFWKSGADKDFHRFSLPNILRDLDLHPDGLRVATAHHDGSARITSLAPAKSQA
jgi:WD40 repeat protein